MMDIGNDDLSHASDRTSSSASSTNYDEIFKNGPPKSNVPVNSRRFSGYIELYEYTMELIEQQTLCFAIWSNKEQQLKAAFDKAFEANGLQRKYETETRKDYETGEIHQRQVSWLDETENISAIKRRTNHTDGTVPWTIVTWSPTHEDGFITKRILVRYGSCPNCWRCMPIGWGCDNRDCSELDVESVATRIYFINETPMPRFEPTRNKVANPIATAEMVGAIAQVSLDEVTFTKQPEDVQEHEERAGCTYYGYDPHSSKLWTSQWLIHWFGLLDFKLHAYLERDLHKVTKIPMSSIQETIDYYKEDHESLYPKRTWDAITRARQLPNVVYGANIIEDDE